MMTEKCLRLFHEADDQHSCTEKTHSKKSIDFKSNITFLTRLLPTDLKCLTFFLSSSLNKQWYTLSLSKCHMSVSHLSILSIAIPPVVTAWLNVLNSLSPIPQSSEIILEIASSCKVKNFYIDLNILLMDKELNPRGTVYMP